VKRDRLTLPIAAIREENDTVRSFTFQTSLPARPGQFVMLTVFSQGEKPFSIMDVTADSFTLTIKKLGGLTQRLFQMQPGDLVSIRGPYGRSFSENTGRVLLIGGGYATPPLKLVARQLREHSVKYLVSVNGARSGDDLLFVADFETWSDRLLLATDDGSRGRQGTSVDVMRQVLREENFDYIYISGPEPMMQAAVEVARQTSARFEVNLERYMKCGVGICGSCVMDPHGFILCQEGPVVDDRRLETLADFGHVHRDKTGRIQKL